MSMTNKEFQDKLAEKKLDIINIDEYTAANNKIRFKCLRCGNIWPGRPWDMIHTKKHPGCPKCSINHHKTNEEFVKELSVKNNKVINIESYITSRTPIKFQCLKCGHIFLATPDSVLRGSGCAQCVGILKKTHDEFVSQMKFINPTIEILGEYENNHTPILCRCTVCNHEWNPIPSDILQRKGCPKCVHSGTSFVEQCIYWMFYDLYGNKVLNRDKTTIGKELDIVVIDSNIAIEYGSWFWHKDKFNNDKEKAMLCVQKGIKPLIVYDSYDGDIITDSSFVTYSYRLSSYDEKLMVFLDWILEYYHIDRKMNDNWFNDIKERAYEHCRKKTTDDFKEELFTINPNIRVLGEYTAARKPIECECLICGNIWRPLATNLLKGKGCFRCKYIKQSENLRQSHSAFLQKVSERLNPNVKIIGQYFDMKTKIKCQCKKCSHIWDALPGDLYHGTGCSKCGGTMRKSSQTFVEELYAINPHIRVLEKYSTHNTPIYCECLICGNIWRPRPKHLLTNHGCPECGHILTGRAMCKKVCCLETDEIFDSLNAAAEWCGLSSGSSITACCKGRKYTAGKYHWKYADEEE